MFEPHVHFIAPEKEDITIWRYMDFTKFVSLLDTGHLYFTRADKLGDPFEGSLPRANATDGSMDSVIPEFARATLRLGAEDRRKANRAFVKCNAINCWHINEGESAAMWKLYLKSDEGIAVRSTYARLRDSITDRESVKIGVVKYLNYESDFFQTGNMMIPFLHKRKSYEHEREVRAIVTRFPIDGPEMGPWENPGILEYGVNVSVDLHKLIQSVQVAPSSQAWFLDLIKSVCQKYGFSFAVRQSEMSSEALY